MKGRGRVGAVVTGLVVLPICGVGTLFASRAEADLIVFRRLPELTSTCDAIVVGKILHVRQVGLEQRRRFGEVEIMVPLEASPGLEVEVHQAEMQVELVMKGDQHVRQGRISFEFPQRSTGTLGFQSFEEFLPGERWLVFLRYEGPVLELVNPNGMEHPKLPTDMPLPERLQGEVRDRVEQFAAWSVRYARREFLPDLLRWTDHICPDFKLENAGVLRHLLESAERDTRLRAAALLCLARWAPAIPALVAGYDALGAHDQVARTALRFLSRCLTSDALAYIGPLLAHPDVDVRTKVIYLVRDIGNPAGIPYLIRALDDPDREVRRWAVCGLAQLSGQMDRWVETEAWKGDEARQIAYWKQWWAEGGGLKVTRTGNPPPATPVKPPDDE